MYNLTSKHTNTPLQNIQSEKHHSCTHIHMLTLMTKHNYIYVTYRMVPNLNIITALCLRSKINVKKKNPSL